MNLTNFGNYQVDAYNFFLILKHIQGDADVFSINQNLNSKI